MPRRYLNIAAVTLLTVGSIVGFLLYLDSIPGSRIPTDKTPAIFQTYPGNKSDSISLKWTYEWLQGIRASSLSISPDGKLLVFVARIDEQCSLVGLNDKGEKVWIFNGLECYPHKDLLPRIVMNDTHLALYWVDSQGGAGDAEGGTEISAFSAIGKKLWNKKLWGIPSLIEGKRLLISQYKNRLHYGWNEKPVFPVGCIDPKVISTAGGDAKAYDIRDKAVILDIETGSYLKEVELIGIEVVSKQKNYFTTSCIGKTAVYDKRYEMLFSIDSSGSLEISPNEKYLVIQRTNMEADKRIVELYSLDGKMLWRKEISPFFRGHEEEIRGDKGFAFLSNGSVAVIDSVWDKSSGYMSSTEVKVSVFNDKGDNLWSKNKVDEFFVRALGVPQQGKTLIMVAEDKRGVDVAFWPNTRLNDIFMKFGIFGIKMHEHLSRLYAIDYHGNALNKSDDIVSSEIEQVVFSANGERIAVTAGGKIYFFTATHSKM